MLITFLILKLTFQSILNECNKLALEQQSKEEIRHLKSRLLKIRLEYETGQIDETTYNTKQNEILHELKGISG